MSAESRALYEDAVERGAARSFAQPGQKEVLPPAVEATGGAPEGPAAKPPAPTCRHRARLEDVAGANVEHVVAGQGGVLVIVRDGLVLRLDRTLVWLIAEAIDSEARRVVALMVCGCARDGSRVCIDHGPRLVRP